MTDTTDTKKRLREYLGKRGIEIKKNILRCPNHSDDNPSAVIYDNQDEPTVWCPVCDKSFDIFEVAGLLDNLTTFPEKLKSVNDTLGNTEIKMPDHPKHEKKKSNPVSLPLDEARKIYNIEFIKQLAIEKGWGGIHGSWKYVDENNEVCALDVRFEGGEKKKEIITFWYDGKSLKWYGTPVFIYNLYECLTADKSIPRLIHEGAKCVEAAKAIDGFIHLSWSGGSAKAGLIDWSVLADCEVFILADDDEPGCKAANKIKEQISNAKIIKHIEAARTIKPQGADIVEIFQVMSPDEIKAYILNPENIVGNEKPIPPAIPDIPKQAVDENAIPFKILGVAQDGRAYFVDSMGRLKDERTKSITKNILMDLADIRYWEVEYSIKGKIDWDMAINDVIRLSQNKDFNSKNIRGRGAWHDEDKISYHDGHITHGEYDDDKIYLRSAKTNIGIDDEPIDVKTITDIKNVIMKLSFKTAADAVRCMSWSVLAAFAGAFKYRPAILLTGPSGAGKTTIGNFIIRKISDCQSFNGSETTVAGIRGHVQKDSCAILLDETEGDTEKKAVNRNDLLSLMRVNVSDNAPDTVKGTKEGGFQSYKMNSMFCFIAINDDIKHIADQNRIFNIELAAPARGSNWLALEKELKILLSDKNCKRIRSLTWKKIKIILSLADRIVDKIREKTEKDFRSSYADALLAAAFMVVWTCTDNPTDIQIENMLDKYYKLTPPPETRDESLEFIDRLTDESIEIIGDGAREKITVMECINRVYCGKIEREGYDGILTDKDIANHRSILSQYGIRVLDSGNIAISNKHHAINKITGQSDGYSRLLRRHPGLIDNNRNVLYSDGKQRKSTILKGIILKKDVEIIGETQELEFT